MNARRVILLLYVVLLTGFGLGAGAMFLEARAEYDALKHTQAALRAKLATAQAQYAERERTLERLRTDPKFVEKQIRKQLGYSDPKETVFRFPD